jgi:hypothetical protein
MYACAQKYPHSNSEPEWPIERLPQPTLELPLHRSVSAYFHTYSATYPLTLYPFTTCRRLDVQCDLETAASSFSLQLSSSTHHSFPKLVRSFLALIPRRYPVTGLHVLIQHPDSTTHPRFKPNLYPSTVCQCPLLSRRRLSHLAACSRFSIGRLSSHCCHEGLAPLLRSRL